MSDLTREVLDIQEAHAGMCKRTGLPLPASMDDMATLASAAPTLARQVEAVEALADRLENEAVYQASRGDTWDAECLRSEARRIRDALNVTD